MLAGDSASTILEGSLVQQVLLPQVADFCDLEDERALEALFGSAHRPSVIEVVECLPRTTWGVTQHESRFNDSSTLQMQPMVSKTPLYASLALR